MSAPKKVIETKSKCCEKQIDVAKSGSEMGRTENLSSMLSKLSFDKLKKIKFSSQ